MTAHLSRITLALLLAVALGLTGCELFGDPTEEPDDRFSGPVTGQISNANRRTVVGAIVRLAPLTGCSECRNHASVTDIDGDFLFNAPYPAVGTYTLTVEAPGYITYTESVEVYGGRVLNRTILGPNQVSGHVVNSQGGHAINRASVTFTRVGGHVEIIEWTLADGFFNIPDAPSGTFDLVIWKEGFFEYRQDGVEITGGSVNLDVIELTPVTSADPIRIELSWGLSPPDLDAHLTGPDGSGGRFHLFYATTAVEGATLDRDDGDGFGPEIVLIHTPIDGMYRFSVHNFNDQSPSGGETIASSPTHVKVYDHNNALIKSYTAPPATSTSGNTWRVFEMTVSGSELTFTDNDGASLGYFLAAHPGDTGVFLTGGSDRPVAKAGH